MPITEKTNEIIDRRIGRNDIKSKTMKIISVGTTYIIDK